MPFQVQGDTNSVYLLRKNPKTQDEPMNLLLEPIRSSIIKSIFFARANHPKSEKLEIFKTLFVHEKWL